MQASATEAVPKVTTLAAVVAAAVALAVAALRVTVSMVGSTMEGCLGCGLATCASMVPAAHVMANFARAYHRKCPATAFGGLQSRVCARLGRPTSAIAI